VGHRVSLCGETTKDHDREEDVLCNAEAADWIKQAAEAIYQAMINAGLTAVVGAGRHERTTLEVESMLRAAAQDINGVVRA
jgi:hypothetical protein